MKKLLCAALAAIILLFAVPASAADVSLKKVEFSGSATGDVISMKTSLDESRLFGASDEFDLDLARFSLIMAMTAGHADDSQGTSADFAPTRYKYIAAFYKTFGFTGAEYHNYEISLSDTSDKVAFSIAQKTISDGKNSAVLLTVPIRGHGYGGEWASNFRVGPLSEEGNHYGFDAAAEGVYEAIRAYINSNGLSAADVKIIVTGFSRAAAVSNLTAAKLDCDSGFNSENIFAYTFATPETTMQKKALTVSKSLYCNIFNVLNPSDAVPEIPLASWGFNRYGCDVYLPSVYSCDTYSAFAAKVRKQLNNLTNNKLDKKVVASLSSFRNSALGMNMFIETLLEPLVNTYESYYKNGAEDSMQAKAVLGASGSDVMAAFMEVFSGYEMKAYSQYTGLAGEKGSALRKYLQISLSPVSVAANYVPLHHYHETYLAWLTVLCDADYEFPAYTRYQVKSTSGAELTVISDGEKLSTWSDADFVLPSAVNAVLSYGSDATGYIGVTASIFTGTGLPVGIVTVSSVPASDAENALTGKYKNNAGAYYTLTFKKSGGGDGSVSDNRIIAAGTKVKITAAAGDNSYFVGWYTDGKLISKKASVNVTPKADRVYTAKFEVIA